VATRPGAACVPHNGGQCEPCDSSTRAREGSMFHGAFYGRRIFGCKTAQFHEMQRESDSFRLPLKKQAVQRCENIRNSLGLNY